MWFLKTAFRFFILSWIFYSCSVIQIFQGGRKPADEYFKPLLPENKIVWLKESEVDKKSMVEESEELWNYKEHIRKLFQSEFSPDTALLKLRAELNTAEGAGFKDLIFRKFVESRAFQRKYRQGQNYKSFIRQFINAAVSEKDDEISMLYSNYFNKIRLLNSAWRNFNIPAALFHPGDTLDIIGHVPHARKIFKETFIIRLEKLDLLSIGGPLKYTLADSSVFITEKRIDKYSRSISEPGIYRVKIFNQDYFQQFNIQVSRLDGIVKTDGTSLLVWGTSYKDIIKPPYRVSIYRPETENVHVMTDSSGIALFARNQSGAKSSEPYKIVLSKDEHIVFLTGEFPQRRSGHKPLYLNLFCSQDKYRPGQTVNYQGILKKKTSSGFGAPDADSVRVAIIDGMNKDVYSSTLPVDIYGQFGDSLRLHSAIRSGEYRISVQYTVDDKSNKGYDNYSYADVSFAVNAYDSEEMVFNVLPARRTQWSDIPASITISSDSRHGTDVGIPVIVQWSRRPMLASHTYFSDLPPEVFFYPGSEKDVLRIDTIPMPPSGSFSVKYQGEYPENFSILSVELFAAEPGNKPRKAGNADIQIVSRDIYLDLRIPSDQIKAGEPLRVQYALINMFSPFVPDEMAVHVTCGGEEVFRKVDKVNRLGRGNFLFIPKQAGDYEITAGIRDSRGGLVTVNKKITVYGHSGRPWPEDTWVISSDRKQYNLNDTAVISVRSGAEKNRVLCAAEGEKLDFFSVKEISGGFAEFKVPVMRIQPNCVLTFSYPLKSAMVSKTVSLSLTDSLKKPSVTVTAKTELSAGKMFEGTIKVSNLYGTVIPAEFVFIVSGNKPGGMIKPRALIADSAENFLSEYVMLDYIGSGVLSQKDLGIQSFLKGFSPQDISLLSGREKNFWNEIDDDAGLVNFIPKHSLREFSQRSAVEAEPVFPDGSSDIMMKTNSQKSEKSVWRTMRSGSDRLETYFSIDVPGDGGSWDIYIIGSTADGVFQYRDKINIEQNLLTNLSIPSGLKSGDNTVIKGVVTNQFNKTISCDINLVPADDGKEILSFEKTVRSVNIGRGESVELSWPVKCLNPGETTVSIQVLSGYFKYVDSACVRVGYDGARRQLVESGFIPADSKKKSKYYQIEAEFPPQTPEASRKLVISAYPTVMHSVLASLQTFSLESSQRPDDLVFSFLPHLYTLKGLPPGHRRDSIFKYACKKSIAALGLLNQKQNKNGGWGWAAGGNSSPEITAAVLTGIGMIRKINNTAWNQNYEVMYQKGIQSALQQLRYSNLSDNKRALLSNLICVESDYKLIEKEIWDIFKKRNQLSSYALALILESFDIMKRTEEKEELAALIEKRSLNLGYEISWSGDFRDVWFSQSVETTAQVIYSLMKVSPGNNMISKAVPFLARKKSGDIWVCPKTTCMVIRSLSLYASLYKHPEIDYIGKIFLNKNRVYYFRSQGDIIDSITGTYKARRQEIMPYNRILIGYEGIGSMFYSVQGEYIVPTGEIKGNWQEVEITKIFSRLVYRQDGIGKWKMIPVESDSAIETGDEVQIRLKIKSYRKYDYVTITDFIPAGFEYIQKNERWYKSWNKKWNYGTDIYRSGDKSVFFNVETLEEGSHEFHYMIKAAVPGNYLSLPAEISPNYIPSYKSFSKESRFNVRPD